jgi:hypothetical protein
MPFPMVSLMVFVVFSNAPPMGLDAFEGDDEEEVEPPPAAPLDALPDVDVFDEDEEEVEPLPPPAAPLDALPDVGVFDDDDDEEEVEPPPPAAPFDGCAGPTKALSEEGPVLGIYLL